MRRSARRRWLLRACNRYKISRGKARLLSHAGEGLVRRGDFSGRVEHGGAAGVVPSDTLVQLQYGNAEIGFSRAEATIDEAGAIRLPGYSADDSLHVYRRRQLSGSPVQSAAVGWASGRY